MWGYCEIVKQQDNSTHPSGSLVRDNGIDLGDNSGRLCDRTLLKIKVRSIKFEPYPMTESSI